MADAARRLGIADDVIIAVLGAERADPRLSEVVATLYGRWTQSAVVNYPNLPPGAREAAFAVTLEQLAREVRRRRDPLAASALRLREHEVLLLHLETRPRVELRRRPYAKWLPASARQPAGALELLGTLVRSASGGRDRRTAAALENLHAALLERAQVTFGRLPEAERRAAIGRAVERLVRPLTAASLTPDNLSRRVRDVAVQELSGREKYLRRERAELLGPESHETANEDGGDPEGYRSRQWFLRAREIIRRAVEHAAPWTREWFKGTKNAKRRAAEAGISHAAMRQRQSRVGRWMRSIPPVLENGDFTRDRPESLRRPIKAAAGRFGIDPAIVREVLGDLEAALRKGILVLPALLWKRLKALLDRWSPRQSDGDSS